jgi:squalene synthase HpnC
MASSVPDAYRECRALAHSHYENFPVASHLLPRRMRDPVAAIYVFARRADDLADEGAASDAERLAALDNMAEHLEQTAAGRTPDDALWRALGDAIPRFGLPLMPFHDLLSAFRQDVIQHRFDRFDDLRDYARRSADPVGRLLLRLAEADTPRNIADSDRICTGLQLINFLQDLHQDFVERDRL